MIVTKNTFVSYSLLKGSVSLQLALIAISFYTVFAFPLALTNDLIAIPMSQFQNYSNVGVVASNVILLIINIITDILHVESFRTWATLISMTINMVLLCVLTICLTAFP